MISRPYFCAVYSTFELIKKFARYYIHASNGRGHGMHSPFVFDFILHVLNNHKNYQPPAEVEILRKNYLSDQSKVKIEDMGAGSRLDRGKSGTLQDEIFMQEEKKVSAIASAALKSKKYAQLMFRLAKHYQPMRMLELGTSLGVTTSYLALANPSALVCTIEGNPHILKKAIAGFSELGIQNIKALEGNFDVVLPAYLEKINKIDLAYIDGNHKKKPTIDYFEQILKKTDEHSILVFDDIHWSREMEDAWTEIQEHPSVRYTIDIFYLGFVFFRKDFKLKQNFSVRF